MSLPPSTPSFLTSLLSTLSSINQQAPPFPSSSPSNSNQPTNRQPYLSCAPPLSNPLANPSPNLKSVLLTLHVLFPNELLPALDLLDRRLVTKLHITPTPSAPPLASSALASSGNEPSTGASTGQTSAGTASTATGEVNASTVRTRYGGGEGEGEAAIYIIHSVSGSTSRLRSDSHHMDEMGNQENTIITTGQGLETGGGKIYEVRLRAWNCTCAGFTFAVFSEIGRWEDWGTNAENGRGVRRQGKAEGVDMEVEIEGEGVATEELTVQERPSRLQFGGMRRGAENEEKPICKHILAALLVDVAPIFRGFAVEKRVSVEEVAGWISGWGDT